MDSSQDPTDQANLRLPGSRENADDDERLSSGYRGPQQEKLAGELLTASILVAYLNGVDRFQWLEPETPAGPEGGVDAVARGSSDPERLLQIQVTTPERLAQQLTHDGLLDYEREAPVDAWVEGLVAAIERKTFNSKSGVVLAIDARQPESFAAPSVVAMFRERHGEWASSFGYDEIYVVGPDVSSVSKLSN